MDRVTNAAEKETDTDTNLNRSSHVFFRFLT